ncbi:glycogen debranching N-terminal domain-containing protein [Catellatospora sp. NPDC049111]|uniref:glycogen debranching N-terminal domain-containing protein n=1 Tax=Catellatospora sp. NPDC049111 TaxID=3155271 RepID=UPI0033F9AA93
MSQEQLVLLDGSTFFTTDRRGDTDGADDGLYFADTRHLSTWRLSVDGAKVHLLSADTPQYYSARIHATLASVRVGFNPTLSVRRDRIVAAGVHEDLVVDNFSNDEQELILDLALGADFADVFEVKDQQIAPRQVSTAIDENSITLRYTNGAFTRATTVRFTQPGTLHNGTVWPHDTAIIAEGLRRYGHHDQAATLAVNLIEAAAAFGYRLPEVFAGFVREGDRPVEYPTPSRPQAWSAGSTLLVLRTLFGLDVDGGTLRATGHRVAAIGPMRLDNIAVRGQRHTAQV